jgi:hypothetical protein
MRQNHFPLLSSAAVTSWPRQHDQNAAPGKALKCAATSRAWAPASAILTVLYPDLFTVCDVRVRNTLGDCQRLGSIKWSGQAWDEYQRFKNAMRGAAPRGLSLRDCDCWLWGRDNRRALLGELTEPVTPPVDNARSLFYVKRRRRAGHMAILGEAFAPSQRPTSAAPSKMRKPSGGLFGYFRRIAGSRSWQASKSTSRPFTTNSSTSTGSFSRPFTTH